jgi:hypothetical protein
VRPRCSGCWAQTSLQSESESELELSSERKAERMLAGILGRGVGMLAWKAYQAASRSPEPPLLWLTTFSKVCWLQ